MDVLTLSRILLRRWYVAVPVVLVTAVGALVVSLRDDSTYTTQGSLMIAPPPLQSPEERAQGTLSAADVASPSALVDVMNEDAVAARIGRDGGSDDYMVSVPGDDGLVRVTGFAAEPEAAIDTASRVLDELERQAELRQEEADIPVEDRLTVEVLTRPTAAIETAAPEGGVRHESVGTARVSGRFDMENPYASTGFAFAILNELVASERGRAELRDAGADADFGLELEDSILRIAVTGESPDSVMRTYQTVARELRSDLEERQLELGITVGERTRLQPLTDPVGAATERGGLVRPLVTIAGLGLVVAIGLTLLVDNLMSALVAERRRGLEGRDGRFVPLPGVAADDPRVPGIEGVRDGASLTDREEGLAVAGDRPSARSDPSGARTSSPGD